MATAKPALRFSYSTALRARTLKVLSAIEHDEDPTLHAGELRAVVLALTEAGMDFYYLKAVKDAKLGFMARQTAGLGVTGAVRIMSPILKSVLGGADGKQLRAIAKHIRMLMA